MSGLSVLQRALVAGVSEDGGCQDGGTSHQGRESPIGGSLIDPLERR